jgi:fatty-acyl-CoA synthase
MNDTTIGAGRAQAEPDPDTLWPDYASPEDLTTIESKPLSTRGLPETTYDVLRRAARLWPDRTAITTMPEAARWQDGASRTYAELASDVTRTANLLHSLGVRRGDAVALLAPNGAELITALLASQVAGVAAPINAGLNAEHIVELLTRSGARVLVCAGPGIDPRVWSLASTVADAAGIEVLIALGPAGPGPVQHPDATRVVFLADAAAAHPAAEFTGEPPRADDIAALFHTGGTTGTPKLAAHTHANEVVDAWSLAAIPILDDDSVVFAGLPLFHVNALVVTLLAPQFRGQSTVWAGPAGYRDPALYREFWRIVEHHRVAAMSAVPTTYAVLAGCPVDADISSLRVAMVGASALPPGVRRDFEAATGVPLLEGYGLTEGTCASVRGFVGDHREGAVGQRMPYQRMKAVEVLDDGTWVDLPAGETGVLAIHGPTVFPGYVVGRVADGFVLDGLGKLRDGWLETGDLGSVDDDGFVSLVGRAKDLIIRGGHNIDPAVIEGALLSHPEVTGANAVGRPDAHSGEVPVAYVTVAADASTSEEHLVRWAAERVTEAVAAPKHVHLVDELPVTLVGKPYKPALRADAARREIADALASVDGVVEVIGAVDDGTVILTVTVDGTADVRAVDEILARYAMRTVVHSTDGRTSEPAS